MRSKIDISLLYTKLENNKKMDKNDNEQVASPATVESPSSTVESSQQRNDSVGDEGLFLAGRYCSIIFSCLM